MERLSKPDQPSVEIAAIDDILQKYRFAVEKAIDLSSFQDSPLRREAKAVMESGGKKLRPVLVLMGCEAVSGRYIIALPAAIAYELAHEASLVQDDIIDDSDLRHDKQTIHKKKGIIGAILVSDFLIFEIFNQLAKYESSALSKKKITQLMSSIASAANGAMNGEFLESQLAEKSKISEADYLDVAGLKTGSMIASAAASGAMIGGASQKVIESFYQFGYTLGIAFQIRDDILDISGNTAQLGKPSMKDLENNACNIVLINAMEKADALGRSRISSMLYKKWFAGSDLKEFLNLLTDLKSLEYASKLAEKYTNLSRECLRTVRESATKDKLIALTYALETRKV